MTNTRLYRWVTILVVLSMIVGLWPAPVWAEIVGVAPGRTGRDQLAPSPTPVDAPALNQSVSLSGLPEALKPVSVSRVQSAYTPGTAVASTLVMTLTVSNHLAPVTSPDITDTATVTDTLAILADFDLADDPNAVRDVIVTDVLTPGVALVSASPPPDVANGELRFNLGDLPPLRDAQVVLTVTVPATVSSATNLNRGAVVYGNRQGRAVTASAPAAVLQPDALAPWLVWTEDADLYDSEMLRALGRVGAEPADLFAFVQGMAFEAYEGSLRGTRGTLWSEAGNSVDQASLLIAMLRAGGVPARYRHGTLPVPEAQTLIASMFPEPAVVRGTVPDDVEKSDPVNDPELLAEVQDHWWVEAYLPGQGWTDLDPAFADAQVGDTFATPAGDDTDQIAELPDAIRHKVDLQLTVEKYYSFPIGGLNLQTTVPLTATISAAQAAGRPINVGFTVESDVPAGMIYGVIEHTYTPYLSIGDSSFGLVGDPIQDLLTTFPLATNFTTGVWLQVNLIAPDGSSERYERTVIDLLGPDVRLNGGEAQLPPRDETPVLGQNELAQLHIMPNSGIPEEVLLRRVVDFLADAPELAESSAQLQELLAGDPTVEEITQVVNQAWLPVQRAQEGTLSWLAQMYQYATTRPGRPVGAESLLTKSYPDEPKLLLLTQTGFDADERQTTFELLHIRERAIAHPGQNADVVYGANFLRTTNDKSIELDIVSQLVPGQARSGYATVLAASEQGVPLRVIQEANLADLDPLSIPADTKARIAHLAHDDFLIVVPEEMVTMEYGEDIGFLAVDPEGNALYLDGAGNSAASAIEMAIFHLKFALEVFIQGTSAGFMGGAIAYIVAFVAQAALLLLGESNTRLSSSGLGNAADALTGKGLLLELIVLASETLGLVTGACSASPNAGACAGGAASAYLFVVTAIAGGIAGGALDPPLPDVWLGDVPTGTPAPLAYGVITPTATLPAASVDVDVTSGAYALRGGVATAWQDAATHGIGRATLTAADAALSQDGVPLGSGALVAADSALSVAGSPLNWDVTAERSVSGYPAAGQGLALGRAGIFTAALTAATPYAATIEGGTVLLDGMGPYTGTLEAEITGASEIFGAGGAPAPTFESNATFGIDGGVMLSDIQAGIVLVGGAPLGGIDALAVAGFNGDVTATEATASGDDVALAGAADFFAINATSSTSSLLLGEIVTITPAIDTNIPGAFDLSVEAPAGWRVGITAAGLVTATPAADAAQGINSLLVGVSTPAYPGLFATAILDIDVLPKHEVAVAIEQDSLITIPMGEILDPEADIPQRFNHVANGQAEIGGAAFTVAVTNDATAAHTYDLAVTGLPAGWTVLGDVGQAETTVVNLAPGATRQVGLYVVPDLTTLLAAGENYPFAVTVTDQSDGSVTDTANATFTMPEVSFPYLTLTPEQQFIAPGGPVSVTLSTRNVGNVAGSFPITVTLRDNAASTRPVSPTLVTSAETFNTLTLSPGESDQAIVTLDMTTAEIGTTYFLWAESEAGEYRPADVAAIEVVPAESAALFEINLCVADPVLSAVTETFGRAMVDLAASCATGDCDPGLQNALLSAIDSYILTVQAQNAPVDLLALETARTSLAVAGDDAAIEAAIADVGDAAAAMSADLCEFDEHRVAVTLTPSYDAILIGNAGAFVAEVTNQGTLTTTYAVTTSLPGGPVGAEITLAPGEVFTESHPVGPLPEGFYGIETTAVAIGPEVTVLIQDTDSASLNVVDRFVQVTAVTADPPFVETGVSATTLGVTVDNIAGLVLPAVAQTQVLAPGGGISYTADIPLTIARGSGVAYELATVDTSGWAAGTYTLTVDLVDEALSLIPDGSGYGLLSVGQALVASHAVAPALVPPGTVTVTTFVTTQVTADFGGLISAPASPAWQPTGLRELPAGYNETIVDENGQEQTRQGPMLPPAILPETATEFSSETLEAPAEEAVESGTPVTPSASIQLTSGITRTEDGDPAVVYTGTWSSINYTPASSGSYHRSETAGDTVAFTFTGTWVGLGFVGGTSAGIAEIFLDGISQGPLDLYRRETTVLGRYFSGLPDATHIITVTVLGTANPLSVNEFVSVDFFDTWDGTVMADGTFEQDDPRLFLSNGWSNLSNGAASGGTFYRSNNATAWFPFTGESITYQALAQNIGGMARISIDGQYRTTLDLFAYSATTRTLSFDGLGAGPHVMQISAYRGNATLDAFTTPGTAPFFDDAPPPGIARFEEDHPAILYNGVPYTQTSTSWSSISYGPSSAGYQMRSDTGGDTISFDFTGPWIGVGFTCGNFCGEAEIFIDGNSQEVIDLYRQEEIGITRYYTGLLNATHTISVTVLGSSNDLSSGARVNFDFFDTWDGTTMADGTFEQDDPRLLLSDGWAIVNNSAASGGNFYRSNSATGWFPFTGDSITYQAVAQNIGGVAKVFIDGQYRTTLDLYAPSIVSRTLSFDGLGSGPHVLQVSSYRSNATLDVFKAPGSAPFFDGLPSTGIVRYEEDNPVLLYNGLPLTQTAQTWSAVSDTAGSGGYYLRSDTAGDTVSFTFDGTWAGIGFVGGNGAGQAEIFLDGESQGVIDLYRREGMAISRYFDGLVDVTHTLSVTVLGTANPFSSNERVNVDFFDAWDGTDMLDGTFEAELGNNERLHLSANWSNFNNSGASNGSYLRSGSPASAWFPFTGDSVSYQAVANSVDGTANVYLDGQLLTRLNLYAPQLVTRTISFEDLGAGPHVLHVAHDRDQVSVDNFSAPGSGPFWTPPALAGLVRYEEDDPALRYNGQPYTSTATSWIENVSTHASRGYSARSEVLSDTVSLTFDGIWASVGLVTNSNGGEAEVFLDGASQGVVDTYSPDADVLPLFYPSLALGTHTLELVVLGSKNITATDTLVRLDYIDVWDGAEEADGWYETDRSYQNNDRVDMSVDWSYVESEAARDGDYYRQGSNAWFRFTGDALTVRGISDGQAGASFEVFIDGDSQGVYGLEYDYSTSPLPFHFTDLGPGPHVARVAAFGRSSVDAFEANPVAFDLGVPMVEWAETDITGDIRNTAVAGDINNDGIVEIVATSINGFMYVYRGDGLDAGGGSPILWSVDLGGEPDTPTLADLDGQPGAEIFVAAPGGAYAFHADGTLYWFTDTVNSTYQAASVGNVDADPEPEIVATGEDCPCIIEPDGSAIAWRGTLFDPLPPNLADLTGDGRLDILVGEADTLYLYDTSTTTPTLAWSTTFTNSIEGRGTPSIADLDGHLPGGEPGPEIALVGNGYVHLVDDDGSLLWSYPTGPGAPGGTSVADITGDGIPEIVATAQVDGGRLYALSADGTLLWDAPALDSTSANSVSVLDLDGDGIWEVVWNGFNQGLTVFRGSDGAILFNEPLINSVTRSDYPIIVDVDGDGSAEIVTGDGAGIYVVGWDDVWAASRPLWNQYNYAITNIGDGLDVPPDEPASWLVHNTYRTQSPLDVVLPTYALAVTHTVPVTGVAVLTETFAITPTQATNPYVWGYDQRWYEEIRSNQFDAVLTDMAPGEVRAVSERTEVAYTLPSGSNRLILPPLYVSAAGIINLAPPEQTVAPGATALYSVTLTNLSPATATYTVTVAGLPVDWLAGWPAEVIVPASGATTVPLTVSVPADAPDSASAFIVAAETGSGATDEAVGSLTVVDPFDLQVRPATQTAAAGIPAAYTVTLTSFLPVTQTISLTVSGPLDVSFPASIELPPNGSVEVPLTALGTADGAQPFTLAGTNNAGAGDSDTSLLAVLGDLGVDVALAPDPGSGGPLSTIPFTVTVTNLGSLVDTYDLAVALPPGWTHALLANGTPVDAVTVSGAPFNLATLQLLVTAPAGTPVGDYPVSITATSGTAVSVSDTAQATATITERGVDVAFAPGSSTSLSPLEQGSWQVLVTNTGLVADTYDLSAAGLFAGAATFTPASVSLDPGQTAQVALTTDPMPFALPGNYGHHIVAKSQADAAVLDFDSLDLTLEGFEAVTAAWLSPTQTVETLAPVTYLLSITNTGNLVTDFALSLELGALTGRASEKNVVLWPGQTARVLANVSPPSAGTFPFSATVASDAASATVPATLIVSEEAIIGLTAENDGPTALSSPTTLSATIASGPSVTYTWAFGDGATGSGQAVQHTYAEPGEYTAVVTATSALDAVTATTTVIVQAPIAGLTADNDGPTTVGDLTTLTASISGGTDVTYSWAFGDGNAGNGAVVTHNYAAPGTYVAEVTASNLVSSVSVTTTVEVLPVDVPMGNLFLPVLMRP